MTAGMHRGRIGALALAAALVAAQPAPAADPPAPSDADPCAILDKAATPAPAALTACRLARERAWGPDDPRLIGLYARLAGRLAGSQKAAAVAVPYRRRAYALATRTHGQADLRTATTALDYARTWILSGRCLPQDPRIAPLLDAARAGYSALPTTDPERPDALRRVAAAYADALNWDAAADTLSASGGALDGGDWERIGLWRAKAGDETAAEAAYLKALAASTAAPDREIRVKAVLKRLYFTRGELDKARALDRR